jgi:ribosomal protein S18 acetylase RimI-like enzyme
MVVRFVNGTAAAGASETARVLDEFPINHHAVCVDKTARIRPYGEADREAIRRLCCDTGYLGGPVEALFQDRELFADLFTRPYLDHAPEWALVAEVDGGLVGYLLGATSRHFDLMLMRSGFRTASKMLFRLATGRYAHHARSERFVRWLLTAGFWEQPKHPANAAHLHWDIAKGFRGRGICRRLWDVYEKRLRAAGVRQCYGSLFSYRKRRPEWVYARYGFQVFDRKPTTLFQPEIADPVEVVCVQKPL